MPDIVIALPDEAATAALGARVAPLLAAGDQLCLSGPLGAGKTSLARAVIRALAGVSEAPSPTFALVETYDAGPFALWHFDLFRLEKPADAFELGIEEAFDRGVALVEWPERIAAYIPPSALFLRLDHDGDGRRARLRGGGDWPQRLAECGFV